MLLLLPKLVPMIALAVAACGASEPIICPACPATQAFTLTLTSSAGGPVPGAHLDCTGAVIGPGPCTTGPTTTTCVMVGNAGTYNATISAPGFGTVTRTIVVQGERAAATCSTYVVEHVDVVMTPSAS
jgi:hypothetical protein